MRLVSNKIAQDVNILVADTKESKELVHLHTGLRSTTEASNTKEMGITTFHAAVMCLRVSLR